MKKQRYLVWFGVAVLALSAGALALSIAEPPGQQRPSTIQFGCWTPPPEFQQKANEDIEAGNAIFDMVLEKIKNDSNSVTPKWMDSVFQKTYLKNPILHIEGGDPLVGWDQVLPELKNMLAKYGILTRGNTAVDLTYLTYNREKNPRAEDDFDFKLIVRTSLVPGQDADPPLEGALFHRRICEIDP
jgi:hypothetical protein